MEQTYQKYDVKRIYASEYAAKSNATVTDITVRFLDASGTKKALVEVAYGDETGWSLVQRYFATNLPTAEDIAAVKGKRIVDAQLQTGWNEEAKAWGKIKATKLVAEGGEEILFNGAKDVPGVALEDED